MVKYRNMQYMSTNYKICKVKLYILDLLTLFQTCSLLSNFWTVKKNTRMHKNPGPMIHIQFLIVPIV